MSWNLSRTINNLAFDVKENTDDIEVIKNKTIHIDASLSPTMNVNASIVATGFISSQQIGDQAGFLMSDGTILTNSQQGQPNIYLYSNNNSSTAPIPSAGQIRANDLNNQLATMLYISHLTSDNIDIDVFLSQITTISVIYMQDKNNSANNVRFNVTAPISLVSNSYVSIPVVYASGSGTGTTDLGSGASIFMSIFDNSQLVDTRISALEGKTRNQSATSTSTDFTKNFNLNISQTEQFNINDVSGMINYFQVANTGAILSRNLNMDGKYITNVAYPDNSSDACTKSYVDNNLESYTPLADFNDLSSVVSTNSNDIDVLQGKTQNMSASSSSNIINKTTVMILDNFGNFIVRDDELNPLLAVNEAEIDSHVKLNLNNNRILNLGNPVSILDATNKTYVDTADNLKLNLSGGTMSGDLNMNNNNITNCNTITALETKTQNMSASSSSNIINKTTVMILDNFGNFIVRDDQLNPLLAVNEAEIDSHVKLNLNNNKILNLGNPVSILDATNKTYVDTQDALQLNLSGGTMTGAINMDNNNISNIDQLSLFTSTSNGLPYFNGSFLANAPRDFFIQSGQTTIQTAINNATVGSVINLSTGSWTESPVICSGQNYTIVGADCATYAQTTQITGNVFIGATTPASTQTRIRIKNIKIIGNLTFANSSTYQELRTFINNCDISGTITFPSSVATVSGGSQIYFTDCSFSGSNNPLCTIPNQALYSIYFTRCTFNSQPITNNLTVGNFSRLIFSDCGTLPSLSLGNCVLNGLNGSAVTTNVSAGSITLGGLASSFLMGNGSLNSTVYSQVSSGTFTMTWSGGGGVSSSSQTIYYSKVGLPNGSGLVTLRFPAFVVAIGASSTTAIMSTAPISVPGFTLNPVSGAPLIAVPIKFNNAQVGLGWIEINTAGNLGIYGPTFGTYWTANTTNCGLGNIATITYTV